MFLHEANYCLWMLLVGPCDKETEYFKFAKYTFKMYMHTCIHAYACVCMDVWIFVFVYPHPYSQQTACAFATLFLVECHRRLN